MFMYQISSTYSVIMNKSFPHSTVLFSGPRVKFYSHLKHHGRCLAHNNNQSGNQCTNKMAYLRGCLKEVSVAYNELITITLGFFISAKWHHKWKVLDLKLKIPTQ